MQARTIITVLDFLLAQNTPPVALWACRRRFFAPRDSAVRKSANETLSGSRLFEHVVRVKDAWGELSENVSDKSGCSSSCRRNLKG